MNFDIYTLPALTVHYNHVHAVNKFHRPWHLTDRDIPSYWNDTGAGEGVHIAVLDTGVDSKHSGFISANLRAETACFKDTRDNVGHGTAMCGAIVDANCGIAPKAQVTCIKVLDDECVGKNISVIQGIQRATELGVDILSMSLGSPHCNRVLVDAIREAAESGAIIVASSGNDEGKRLRYPAALDEYVLAVGAVDRLKRRSAFSNYDAKQARLDVVDYGQEVITCAPKDRYTVVSGTSIATALCAGALANVISLRRKLGSWAKGITPYAQLLKECCEDLGRDGRDRDLGWGIIDPSKAFVA